MSAAVFTKMAALAGCLKTELNAEGFSECRLIVTAAESLDLSSDLSNGDIAWVSLVRAEPNLSIDFVAPAPVGVEFAVTARIRDRSGRKLWIEATGEGPEGVFARAEGLFLTVDLERFRLEDV